VGWKRVSAIGTDPSKVRFLTTSSVGFTKRRSQQFMSAAPSSNKEFWAWSILVETGANAASLFNDYPTGSKIPEIETGLVVGIDPTRGDKGDLMNS